MKISLNDHCCRCCMRKDSHLGHICSVVKCWIIFLNMFLPVAAHKHFLEASHSWHEGTSYVLQCNKVITKQTNQQVSTHFFIINHLDSFNAIKYPVFQRETVVQAFYLMCNWWINEVSLIYSTDNVLFTSIIWVKCVKTCTRDEGKSSFGRWPKFII